jgi:serine/threonine-protein phosphatase 2A regulatory subunit B
MNGAATPEPTEASAPTPQAPLDWRFSQVFGERGAGEDVQDVDIISAIEFNKSGHHLATGDRGGRVVLFERIDSKDVCIILVLCYKRILLLGFIVVFW